MSSGATRWTGVTLAPLRAGEGLRTYPGTTLRFAGDRIVGWERDDDAPPLAPEERVVPLEGALVTPGLVDCHTHLVWGGDRADEYARRLAGVPYETIAREGGGIRSTVRATRAATTEALLHAAVTRAIALRDEGVTTLEIKSGYGLSLADERRCLDVAARVGTTTGQSVHRTFLGAHAVAPEYEGDADRYLDDVIAWMAVLHEEGHIDSVDAFCESIAFSRGQVDRLFAAARALGLPVRLHAEQLSLQDGAHMAASHGALSCDHLEWLDNKGVGAMATAGTVAVLLPGAFTVLRETRVPPVEALRAAGVPMAVATDCNPGTSPTTSLLLMAQLACLQFGLTPDEALRGITVEAARALGHSDRGRIEPGLRADLVAWNVPSPAHLVYGLGSHRAVRVVAGGTEISG